MLLAEIIVWGFLAYAAVGAVFAVYFSFFRVREVDESANGAGLGFRLIIVPGAIALWPVWLWRLVRGAGRPSEGNAHRNAVKARVEGR